MFDPNIALQRRGCCAAFVTTATVDPEISFAFLDDCDCSGGSLWIGRCLGVLGQGSNVEQKW